MGGGLTELQPPQRTFHSSLYLFLFLGETRYHKINEPLSFAPCICDCLPRELVARSATFWKASRKAAVATTVVLEGKKETEGSLLGPSISHKKQLS